MATVKAKPRLSIVVTARNDDHGGGLLRRMQVFVDGLLEQATRHGLNGELILVEWNPPPGRPSLADALRWPKEPGPCRVRIIEVPAEIHRRFQYADRLGLFQMIAKNVGIRRARGEFVLSTNVDLLFTDALMKFLASGALEGNCMYRTERYDVSADVPLGVPISKQLDYCRRHVLRVYTRRGTFVPGQIWWVEVPRRVAARMVRRLLPTTPHARARFRHAIARARRRLARRDPSTTILTLARSLSLRWLYRAVEATRQTGLAIWNSRTALLQQLGRPLHGNACGDFTLLSRERWFALRGYPEFRMFSVHLDSVLCQMAAAGGARERVLDDEMRLYHIEHGSGWSPGEAEILAARIAALGIPILDYRQYRVWVNESRRRGGPIIFNDEDWGLARERLPEADPIGEERGAVTSVPEHTSA